VRDRDRADAAELANFVDGGVVDQRDAVPQEVALWRADEERTLANGERRLRSYSDETEILAHLVLVRLAKLIKGSPLLA
jgi:hypothetical protein